MADIWQLSLGLRRQLQAVAGGSVFSSVTTTASNDMTCKPIRHCHAMAAVFQLRDISTKMIFFHIQ
jgi:hypothetical protein